MADKNTRPPAFAKTTRPAIAPVVPRERLYTRLDGAPRRTFAWISGPPGSGKTCLAASYVEARRYRVLWYQLDADDSDVATFFHYLAHAAGKLDARRGRDFPAYAEQFGADVAAFARKFFRHLFAHAKEPIAVVLDSLHAVGADSPLHAVVEAASVQIPRGCCIIVTSRNEPPASLARLRLTGEMVSVSGEQLRFNAQELEEVARLRGRTLAGESLAQLEERTRGWAAGVVLMLEHEKFSGHIPEYPSDATPTVVFDYLAGEIFDRFEEKTQQFLLRIACLPRMTVGVAEALSGEPKGGRLLVNLSLNDYFVSDVRADEGRIFQLHPLLRDFLLTRAAQDLPEAVAPAHLQRAAQLLRDAGQVEDAVSLLIESRDWPAVARIAAEEAGAMLAQGRVAMLAAWLERVPETLIQGNPALLYAIAACHAGSSPREARRLLERAYEGFRGAEDDKGMLASCCGIIDATILEFDDLTGLDRWVDELDRLMGRVGRDAGQAGVDYGAAAAGAHLKVAHGMAKLLRGDFVAAGALFREIDVQGRGVSAHVAIESGVAGALFQLFAGFHQQALELARENIVASRAEGVHACDGWLHGVAAAACLTLGDLETAREELQAASTATRRGDRSVMHYLRAWLALLEDDIALAHAEARSAAELSAETGMPWLECLARVAWAQTLAERGDRRGFDAQLHRAGVIAERLQIPNLRFAVQLAQAEGASRASDREETRKRLAEALAYGREHDIRHVAGWRPHAVAELCALALRHDIEPDYVRSMVRSRGFVPKTSPVRVRGWPWPFRARTFGAFRLLRDEEHVEFAGKGPGRPMELLKVLIAQGGKGVRSDQLADALWPHVDADYAHNSFTSTLHRLRRLIGDDEAVILGDSRVSLNPAMFWVDTWALEQAITELDSMLRAPHAQRLPEMAAITDEIFALYLGPFLADESEQPAYIACREQIRARILRCITRVARGWEEAGKAEAAVDCYLRCIEADPLFEAPYRNLMLCYQRNGDAIEARSTYNRLRTLLAARLNTAPSPETQAVLAALAEGGH